MMISLADLQSALTLLSSTKTNQQTQTPSVAQTALSTSKTAISGAASQPSSPAFYTMSFTQTFSVEDGQIESSFEGTTSGPGAPDITSTSDYQNYEVMVSENSLTSQQLTADAYSNATIGSGDDASTFFEDINLDYNQDDGSASIAGEIEQALANGTLQVQNAADVQGLDYTSENTLQMTDGSGTDVGNTSMNIAFLDNNPDGLQHALLGFGSVEAYLTW